MMQPPVAQPQSNQRGIETGVLRKLRSPHKRGLNRTSVGLKLIDFFEWSCEGNLPQSNQRGIET